MARTRAVSRTPVSPLPVLLALAALFLPAISSAQNRTRYTIPGSDVAVYNLIGETRVIRGTGTDVEVEIEWGGDDAGDLKVETGKVGGKETLRVVYPGDRFVYKKLGFMSNTQMTVNDDGTFGGRGRSGRKVRISGRGSGFSGWADMTIKVPDGKTFALRLGVGEVSASGVNADLLLDTSASPVTAEAIRGALSIDVGSGAVHVSGIDGDLDIDTGSGSVTMQGVKGKVLHVDTGSGNVSGSDISAADIHIDTGSGGIDIVSVRTSRVSLDTGSGGVDLGLLSDIEDLVVDTGSGHVRIAVPASLGAEVDVETGSGGVDIDVPHESHRHKRNYFHGTIGDGKGRISVETGSGGVRFSRS